MRRLSFDARWKWRLIAPDALEPSLGAHSVRRNPPPLPPDVGVSTVHQACSQQRACHEQLGCVQVRVNRSDQRCCRRLVVSRVYTVPYRLAAIERSQRLRIHVERWRFGAQDPHAPWRMRSDQGWLERVLRTEAPSLDRSIEAAYPIIRSREPPSLSRTGACHSQKSDKTPYRTDKFRPQLGKPASTTACSSESTR